MTTPRSSPNEGEAKNPVHRIQAAEIQRLLEKAKDWIQSAEGRKGIENSLLKSRALAEKMQKLRQVDSEILREPFTL